MPEGPQRFGVKLSRLDAERRDGEYAGGVLRAVSREIDHHDGLNRFLDSLWRDPSGGWSRLTVEPTGRAVRQFYYQGRRRRIMPDSIAELVDESGGRLRMMIEYERRAKAPSAMRVKTAPYFRYFDSEAYHPDEGAETLALFVLSSQRQETSLLRSVREMMEETGLSPPILCATEPSLSGEGPFRSVWKAWRRNAPNTGGSRWRRRRRGSGTTVSF